MRFLLVAPESWDDNHAVTVEAEGGPALCGEAEPADGWFLAGSTTRLFKIDCNACRERAAALLSRQAEGA